MPQVTVSSEEGLAVVRIDRPPANAMSLDLLQELVAAVAGLQEAPPPAVVLAGREGFFSAGADLKAVPAYGPQEQQGMVRAINDMALGVYDLPCPVVGAITGHAIAGGMVLALCTDLRIASSEGSYGLTEVKVGVPYPQAALGVVQAELAPHAARRLAFGNRLVDAVECVSLGVFDESVEPSRVIPRALEVARELSRFPAETYTRTKRDMRGETVKRLRAAVEEDPLLARWVG